MRPVTRQSVRLATSTRSRHSSVPRQRVALQQRNYTATVPRSSEPRNPNGQPDHHAPLNGLRESPNRIENETKRADPNAEEENGEERYASDSRKSSSRRGFRPRRVNDVPKAPPIPRWFLDQNVRLVEESPGIGGVKGIGSRGYDIRCVDIETGHTLFTVPHFRTKPESSSQERGSGHSAKYNRGEDIPEFVINSESASIASRINKEKTNFDLDFFDQKSPASKEEPLQHLPDATKTSASTEPVTSIENAVTIVKSEKNEHDPMRWIYLEADTSVRAALSLADGSQRSSSFAADRVDLSLQCPDPKSHDQMDDFVADLAGTVKADLIRLDANDFAELTEDYVAQGDNGPGSFSNLGYEVFDGYQAAELGQSSNPFRAQTEEDEENEMDDEDEEDEEERNSEQGVPPGFGSLAGLNKALKELRSGRGDMHKDMRVFGIKLSMPQFVQESSDRHAPSKSSMSGSSEMNRDDARLDVLLDSLLDVAPQKRSKTVQNTIELAKQEARRLLALANSRTIQGSHRLKRMLEQTWLEEAAKLMIWHLINNSQHDDSGKLPYKFTAEPIRYSNASNYPVGQDRRTIVHVRDLRDLCNTRLGDTIIRRLVKVVRKRRRSGEQIVIVGTTAQDVPGPFRFPGDHADDFPFRTVTVPPFFNFSFEDELEYSFPTASAKSIDDPAHRRILEINLRHIQTMMRRLRPDDDVDLTSANSRKQLNVHGMYFLTEKVLSMDRIQALALMAIGLSRSYATAETVQPVHVTLAALIAARAFQMKLGWSIFQEKQQMKKAKSESESKLSKDKSEGASNMDQLRKSCNSHETRLLSGVVDPQNIKTRFEDVHAPPETLDALKTLTSLSLLRPDAFKYGVLANDRLPGLLLYGPPGTGKTLLAKAVAKESKATVLEVSGAQIYEKYVGEGEKMVRAVFSLAKKLSPCIVFIDEADAIFGSRSNAGNRNTHREIINQFLREWDGMDDHGVFMMVASNRPFDLDDAVLRRLPRRLLVDLPVAKDRESILGIHLRNENLDASVSLSKLAEQTPLYSGSDLKNLSVAAALAAVREENELAESRKDDKDFKLPAQRTLTLKHFDKAIAEISASISEDMSSLSAIRKFDEQYGDRRGRRQKTAYGFGAINAAVDENAARVRQSSPPPP